MKNTLLIILLFLCANVLRAQENGSIIKGQLKDSSGEYLTNATVKLVRAKDSFAVRQTISNKNGFVMSRVAKGNYFLQFSFIGYADTTVFITVGSKDSVYNIGVLFMKTSKKDLMEVIIKSTIPPVITRNDTIIYNTSAFKTRPNATVEELLKKLPGIEIDKDGNISFQGEKVQKIYVDGKEFFINDPKLISQNFLADMLQKVEVFDEKSERAKLTGIPDEKPGKALNLRLKPDKRKGYFGNINGTYASQNTTALGVSASYLNGDAMAMMGAGISNSDYGRISNHAKNISLNYQNRINQDLQYNLSYGGGSNGSRSWAFKERQTFMTDSSLSQEQEGASAAEGISHSFNLGVNYKIDSFSNLNMTGAVGLQNSKNSSGNMANSSIEKAGTVQPVNSALTKNNSSNNNWNGNVNLNYNRRFRKQGRFIGLSFNSNKNQNNGDAELTSLTKFYDHVGNTVDSIERNQRSDQHANGFTFGVAVSYTEPIGKQQVLDFNYNLNSSTSENNNKAYNYNPVTGKYDEPDSIASNSFENNNGAQSFGIGYNNFKSSKFRYQAGIGMSKGRQQNDNKSNNLPDIEQKTTNIFPRASLMYTISKQRNISFAYSGNSRQPLITELQPLPDYSNPLLIRLGNPGLKAEFNNELSLGYKEFNSKKMRSLTMNINYRNTMNRIVNSVVTNAQGIQEQQSLNMNGDYGFRASAGYDMPVIKQNKTINLRYKTSISFSRDANLVNKQINKRRAISLNQGISFNYHPGEKLDVSASGNFSFRKAGYSIQTSAMTEFISHRYTANISYELPFQFVLTSDFSVFFNNSQRSINGRSSAVWNANVMKRLFKNKTGEFRFSVSDILNDRKDVNQTIGDNYIETSRTEVVRRMMNLTFVYRFRGNRL